MAADAGTWPSRSGLWAEGRFRKGEATVESIQKKVNESGPAKTA